MPKASLREKGNLDMDALIGIEDLLNEKIFIVESDVVLLLSFCCVVPKALLQSTLVLNNFYATNQVV